MNANDVICVGAEPIALLDYVAVEEADPESLGQIGEGLREGAERAGVEIPGGELAVLPELICGAILRPTASTSWASAWASWTSTRSSPVTGSSPATPDRHSLERHPLQRPDASPGAVLTDLEERPELGGTTVGETAARADGDLRAGGPGAARVRGRRARAGPHHRRGLPQPAAPRGRGGLPARLSAAGAPRVRADRASAARWSRAELYEVFNMGCGFCCVVPAADAHAAVELLGRHHPGTAVIGQRTTDAGVVELPGRAVRVSPGGRAGRVQARSHSSPVSTRTGRTRPSPASRHSSASARRPGQVAHGLDLDGGHRARSGPAPRGCPAAGRRRHGSGRQRGGRHSP